MVKKRKYGARVVPFAMESSSGGWLSGEAKGLTDKVVEHMSEHAKKAAAAFKIQRAIGIELIMHLHPVTDGLSSDARPLPRHH